MGTWATWDGSTVYLDGCTDNQVYFRADPENPNTNGFHKDDWDHGEVWTHHFMIAKSVKAGGNIQFLLESTGARTDVPTYCYAGMFLNCTSLTNAPALPATTLADSCYSSMFYNCSALTTAPALPATTLADTCYGGMFRGCTSLTTAPSLPATTLADTCYGSMFSGCSSLATAPATLPAITLADYCYKNMFDSCTSLTTAPELPATTLAYGCYQSMFSGCSSLTSMDVSFTAWDTNNTSNWVNGVAASGTFTCPSILPNSKSISKIPFGWTKVDK